MGDRVERMNKQLNAERKQDPATAPRDHPLGGLALKLFIMSLGRRAHLVGPLESVS